MTSPDQMRQCFDLVTTAPAQVMGLADYGIAPGRLASLVVMDAADPIEAIRRRPERLAVISKGRVIARTTPAQTTLSLPRR